MCQSAPRHPVHKTNIPHTLLLQKGIFKKLVSHTQKQDSGVHYPFTDNSGHLEKKE